MTQGNNDAGKHGRLLFIAITIVFAIAIFVCVLCDLILSHALTWSLYATVSCVLVWLTVLPLIKLEKHRILAAVCMFSILVIPFLFAIEFICPAKGWMIPLGVPASIVSLVFLWIAGIILLKIKWRGWYKASVIILLLAPVAYFINYKVSVYLQGTGNLWNVIDALIMICLSVFLFVMGLSRKKKIQTAE